MDYKNPFFLTVLDKGYNSRENARNFLKLNKLSDEEIAQCCSLPLEQVFAIKKELEQMQTE